LFNATTIDSANTLPLTSPPRESLLLRNVSP
jgi:hypothetical protein